MARLGRTPKACPPLLVVGPTMPKGSKSAMFSVEAETDEGLKPVAHAKVDLSQRGLVTVDYINVESTALQRCGVGTRLYTALRNFACQQGRRLASDTSRTDASEGFWAKQTRKGRAECIDRRQPGRKLNANFDEVGFWSCGRYALHDSCGGALDGVTLDSRGLRARTKLGTSPNGRKVTMAAKKKRAKKKGSFCYSKKTGKRVRCKHQRAGRKAARKRK